MLKKIKRYFGKTCSSQALHMIPQHSKNSNPLSSKTTKNPGAEAPGNQAQLPALGNWITRAASTFCGFSYRLFLATVFTFLNTSAISSAVALSIS